MASEKIESGYILDVFIRKEGNMHNENISFPNMFNLPYDANMSVTSMKKTIIGKFFQHISSNIHMHTLFTDKIVFRESRSRREFVNGGKMKEYCIKYSAIEVTIDANNTILTLSEHNNDYFIFPDDLRMSDARSFINKKLGSKIKTFYQDEKMVNDDMMIKDLISITKNAVLNVNLPQGKVAKNSELITDIDPRYYGSLYLIRPSSAIKGSDHVYKIGKTEKEDLSRLSSYEKGGKVYFTIAVKADIVHDYEQQLIKIFCSKYIQRKDYGTEYFEGDFSSMIGEIYNLVYPSLLNK